MEINYQRVLRLTILFGAIGALAILVKWGLRDALGFITGAALSYMSFRSWERLAESVGASGKAPAMGSAVFLSLRYLLIGVAIYVMIVGLGSRPAALIVGLLISFLALTVELLRGALGSK